MPFQITTTVTCYLLPQDGAQAKADFLKHLLDPGETWITAYAFTLTDMINDLIAAHKAGIPLHIYLDHSQEVGKVEKPLVQQLVGAGVEVTIGTSPAGSQYICHTKGMVSDPAAKGGSLWCWEGSTNFSLSAWQQVNTALVFASQQWRDEFVAQFEALVEYAWTNEKSMQLMPAPPLDVGKAPAATRARYGLTPARNSGGGRATSGKLTGNSKGKSGKRR
ncbi:MAG TPA: phospholipase D-like domain-containing protein [Candidatus Acidoferrales bacterium]|nr:phospholipase D-like domain-containing protein [Candidatus Acidoferrales bacterium]